MKLNIIRADKIPRDCILFEHTDVEITHYKDNAGSWSYMSPMVKKTVLSRFTRLICTHTDKHFLYMVGLSDDKVSQYVQLKGRVNGENKIS